VDAPDTAKPAAPSALKRRILWALRIGGTIAGFAYVASIVSPGEVGAAIARVSPWAFLGACAVTCVNLGVGALRWRILLAAYGAPHAPPMGQLARAYFIGFFYNNYLPGGLGGDLVRGVVTRAAFGERGTTASMTVVLVERVLGLSGLLLLVSTTTLVRPLPGTENVLPFSGLLLLAAGGAVIGIAAGRRLAPHLPGRLGQTAAALPGIERFAPFVTALLMSLVTQALVAMTGWVLMASITAGQVGLDDALVVVPLAMATAYFPLSVGGAGAREAAYVALGVSALGMSEADALASSLLLWISQLAVGALGGVVQLVAPVGKREGQ
jgi:uncharacterized membrane protein YbhN (UPF0104 family)